MSSAAIVHRFANFLRASSRSSISATCLSKGCSGRGALRIKVILLAARFFLMRVTWEWYSGDLKSVWG